MSNAKFSTQRNEDQRSDDRFLVSISKCPAAVTVEGTGTMSGYLLDVSASGCSLVIDSCELPTHTADADVQAGEHRFPGRIIRAAAFGTRLTLGIEASVPLKLLAEARTMGGAIRFSGKTVAVIGKLNMPVAIQAIRLMHRPDVTQLDLGECTDMEMAGAGFVLLMVERDKRIVRISAAIRRLMHDAGFDLDRHDPSQGRSRTTGVVLAA